MKRKKTSCHTIASFDYAMVDFSCTSQSTLMFLRNTLNLHCATLGFFPTDSYAAFWPLPAYHTPPGASANGYFILKLVPILGCPKKLQNILFTRLSQTTKVTLGHHAGHLNSNLGPGHTESTESMKFVEYYFLVILNLKITNNSILQIL